MKLQIIARPFQLSLVKGKTIGITIPELISAEIGNVNGYTVVTTWDSPVNIAPAVGIEVNGILQSITSSQIQTDTTIVHYITPIPWHGSDDVVTVNGHTATNNIIWKTPLLLQADTLISSDGLQIPTFPDESIYGHDFSQSNILLRPFYVANDEGYPAVYFGGFVQPAYMTCPAFADALPNFEITTLCKFDTVVNDDNTILAKLTTDTAIGWLATAIESGISGLGADLEIDGATENWSVHKEKVGTGYFIASR